MIKPQQVIAWDVVNENIHFDYLESVYGKNASAVMFIMNFDSGTTSFLNEFNTIEVIGIGLEAHFGAPNLPYMRASIDKLAAAGVPVWLTEVDVASGPNQVTNLLHAFYIHVGFFDNRILEPAYLD